MSAVDVNLEVSSDALLLGVVRDAARAYLSAREFPPDRVLEVVLAVDEVCSNAIRHAYKGELGHPIWVTMGEDDTYIEFVIRDDGECRPSIAFVEKPEPESLDDATIGGYGIQIVHEVCDEVKFETREPRGNIISVKVKRESKARASSSESA